MWNLNAWGRVLVSLIVVSAFVAITTLYITTKINGNNTPEILSILLGALASNFTAVVQYWIGSSSGSASKDDAIKTLATGVQS